MDDQEIKITTFDFGFEISFLFFAVLYSVDQRPCVCSEQSPTRPKHADSHLLAEGFVLAVKR